MLCSPSPHAWRVGEHAAGWRGLNCSTMCSMWAGSLHTCAMLYQVPCAAAGIYVQGALEQPYALDEHACVCGIPVC